MSLRDNLCDACLRANPLAGQFPPAEWQRYQGRPEAVHWSYGVWLCAKCQNLWYAHLDKHEMIYVDVTLLPPETVALFRKDTRWETAWAMRDVPNPMIPQFITAYLSSTRMPWREAAPVIVTDALQLAEPLHALKYLRALFSNYNSMIWSWTSVEDARRLWEQCAPLQPAPESALWNHWQYLAERATQSVEGLERRGQAQIAEAAKIEAARFAPPVPRPLQMNYTQVISSPEPVANTLAYQPRTHEIWAQAKEKLMAGGFSYFGPAVASVILLDACSAKSPQRELHFWAVFPMCLMAYAAVASKTAKRWDQPFWKLYIDRFGQIFQLWGVLVLVLLAALFGGMGLLQLIPDGAFPPLVENALFVTFLALPAARLWPVIVTTYVYKGYVYYQSIDVSDVHVTWIGPSLKVAWRISRQKAFFKAATLPLFAAAAVLVTFLALTGWAWWARWACYFIALPVMLQFADEAVDGWRILTGRTAIDR